MEGIRQARQACALLAVALLAAACSSGSSGSGAASAAASAGAGGSSSASPGQSAMARGIAYARCMRSHGLPKFPDPAPGPNGQGLGWQLGPASGVAPGSPQYQAATKACGQPPNLNGAPPQPLTAAQQQQYLKWAACIRAHGVPGFKDPTFPGGYPRFTSNSGHGAQMQAAEQACQHYLHGIGGGGGITSG